MIETSSSLFVIRLASVLGLVILTLGCGSVDTLDEWLGDQISTLNAKNQEGVSIASDRRASWITRLSGRDVALVMDLIPDDDKGLRVDADEYRESWLEDLRIADVRRVADQDQARRIQDELSRQSSRVYRGEDSTKIGKLDGAEFLIRIRGEVSYTPNLPTPEPIERGLYRYRSTKLQTECLDLETGEVIHSESVDMMMIVGPSRG